MMARAAANPPMSATVDTVAVIDRILPGASERISDMNPSMGIFDRSHDALKRTAEYIFDHHKRGIVVQIRSGKIEIFGPFANMKYKNSLSTEQVDAYMKAFGPEIAAGNMLLKDPKQWYVDGCLIKNRTNWMCNTPDWYYAEFYFLLTETLRRYPVPDCDFIMNPANFPLLMCNRCNESVRTWCNPNENLFPSATCVEVPLPSQPAPVLSMFSTPKHNDILIPTGYDVNMANPSTFFLGTSSNTTGCSEMFPKTSDKMRFQDKKDAIVWRGALSTCGGTETDSCRRKIASIQTDFIDAKITDKMKDTPRLVKGVAYLTNDAEEGSKMTREQQLEFKYIMVLGGTNTNSSFAYNMQFNSVIVFGGDAGYNMWYSSICKPGVHYLPIDCSKPKPDVTKQLKNIVEFGRTDTEGMLDIIKNAQQFFKDHITNDFMAAYMFHILCQIGHTQHGGKRSRPKAKPALKKPRTLKKSSVAVNRRKRTDPGPLRR
jgi:hypothetical protein